MRSLRLVGLNADGNMVVFVDETGAEFAAPADDRLRATLRGDRARLGQLEIEMDSVLRPRDIQARIRSGDSPESVATLAQVSVDRIMPYCVPVLAERQHVAELARRSHVRRKNAEGPARRLSDVVTERLRSRNVDPESAEWDAWRRDDGRWTVLTSYHSGERLRSAEFVFDTMGRYSLADDDEAKWLTGERQATRRGPQPREGRPGERRLSAVPGEHDLLDLDDEETDDLTAVVRAVNQDDDGAVATEVHKPARTRTRRAARAADTGLDTDDKTSDPHADVPAATTDVPSQHVDAEPAQPRVEPTPSRKKRNGRASVPTWDEIMFGKDDGA